MKLLRQLLFKLEIRNETLSMCKKSQPESVKR